MILHKAYIHQSVSSFLFYILVFDSHNFYLQVGFSFTYHIYLYKLWVIKSKQEMNIRSIGCLHLIKKGRRNICWSFTLISQIVSIIFMCSLNIALSAMLLYESRTGMNTLIYVKIKSFYNAMSFLSGDCVYVKVSIVDKELKSQCDL